MAIEKLVQATARVCWLPHQLNRRPVVARAGNSIGAVCCRSFVYPNAYHAFYYPHLQPGTTMFAHRLEFDGVGIPGLVTLPACMEGRTQPPPGTASCLEEGTARTHWA